LRALWSQPSTRALHAVCDALLSDGDPAWRAAVVPRVMDLFDKQPNQPVVRQLQLLLAAMEWPPAGLVLAGRLTGAFSTLRRPEREGYLRRMATHPLGPVRTAFQALKRAATVLYYADTRGDGTNPVWPSLAYPGPVSVPSHRAQTIAPLEIRGDVTLSCDAVVIGSGAGGGVAAGELAAAGLDVIVLEKGGYYHEPDFSQREIEMYRRLYLDAATTATLDQGVVILAGSCLGGGTVVNYTTSFRTPDAIRAEWTEASGLPLFAGPEFSAALDAVCAALQVNRDHNRPSRRDALMAAGLRTMGWHVDAMPRNVVGCAQDDSCGYCGLGCVHGAKRSTLATYLQRAFDAGARIAVDCAAGRVLVERGRAAGVVAQTGQGHTVTVRARAVIAAAGTLHTPALLLRSGLAGGVGTHLHLHPATAVLGRFRDDVRPWSGTLQAYYSDQFADLDAGYGVKFETVPLHPSFLALGAPWQARDQFDAVMRDLPRLSFVGILPRDRSGGRVTVTRSGVPIVHYAVSRYDRGHVRHGVRGAAELLLAAGAEEILTMQNRPVRYRPRGGGSLRAWRDEVDRVGFGPNHMQYFSFHQMGTCRMGARRRDAVTNGDGEVYGVSGLFVADASLFPSASGVNPMVTVAALAYHVAQQVRSRL
jgi:choline dehydrogenase-like flavoprotein